MKDAEDEAFEDIERRQGGGFKAKQAMAADKVGPFERWWYYEGSGPPQKGEDCEEHTKRMCKIAWSNGADVAAQPAQQPVAWTLLLTDEHHGIIGEAGEKFIGAPESYQRVNVYTTPPKREWVGLTDEDRKAALLTAYKEWECEEFLLCAREDYLLIEQALKEKNNG